MKDKYHQIMDRIQVTEEMQTRILQKIEQEEVEQKAQSAPFKRIAKIVLPIAACIALLIGAFQWWFPFNNMPQDAQISNPILQVSSAKELSSLLGFDIMEIEDVPFPVCEVVYTSYNDQLAEIKYAGETASCVLRQSKGTADISGDYSEYPYEGHRFVGENNLLLRGNSPEALILATWSENGYSYSLAFSDGVSLETVEQIIQSMKSSEAR